MDIEVIWVRPETKYFCKWGWTAELLNTTDLPVGHQPACPPQLEERRRQP
jgi:hypothetical protein